MSNPHANRPILTANAASLEHDKVPIQESVIPRSAGHIRLCIDSRSSFTISWKSKLVREKDIGMVGSTIAGRSPRSDRPNHFLFSILPQESYAILREATPPTSPISASSPFWLACYVLCSVETSLFKALACYWPWSFRETQVVVHIDLSSSCAVSPSPCKPKFQITWPDIVGPQVLSGLPNCMSYRYRFSLLLVDMCAWAAYHWGEPSYI